MMHILERSRFVLSSVIGIVAMSWMSMGCSSTTEPTVAKLGVIVAPTTTLEFGAVIVGRTAVDTLRLTNTGNDTVVVSSLSVTGTSSITLSRVANSSKDSIFPIRIAPSTDLTLVFACTPRNTGNQSATAALTLLRAKDSNISIPLHATAISYIADVGDSYTYDSSLYDENHSLKSTGRFTMTVVNSDTTLLGMDHAMLMSNGAKFKFESSGDVSWYYPSNAKIGNFGAMWLTIPLSAKAPKTFVDRDTVAIIQGNSAPMHLTATNAFVGLDSVFFDGAKQPVYHGMVTVTYTTTGFGAATSTRDFYFSPKLGFFALIAPALVSTINAPGLTIAGSSENDVIYGYTIQ